MTAKQIAERAIFILSDNSIQHFSSYPEELFGIGKSDASRVQATFYEIVCAMAEEFRNMNNEFMQSEYESFTFGNWVHTIQTKIITFPKDDPLLKCRKDEVKFEFLKNTLYLIEIGELKI